MRGERDRNKMVWAAHSVSFSVIESFRETISVRYQLKGPWSLHGFGS